jgi:superfamily II DNA/RNA helicase
MQSNQNPSDLKPRERQSNKNRRRYPARNNDRKRLNAPNSEPNPAEAGQVAGGRPRDAGAPRSRRARRPGPSPRQTEFWDELPFNDETVYVSIESQEEKVLSTGKLHFDQLQLDEKILAILARNNFFNATIVQEETIPAILEGRNIFCSSETGSGKTLAFLLPMVQKLMTREISQALVISPTREIAMQTHKTLSLFEAECGITSGLVIGGTDMRQQREILRRYPAVIIATPGRMLDMLKAGLIWLEYTGYVVLDEADRMLDMGFEPDLLAIHRELTGPHQTLLFSATMFPQVKKVAARYASDYEEIIIGEPASVAGSVEHYLIMASEHDRIAALKYFMNNNPGKMLVFFNTIKETIQIASRLKREGLRNIDCIHSGKSQDERNYVISAFRSGEVRVLLGSDVAARGIDIPNVEMVVNYRLPSHSEEYIHRVGRTGRAGKSGVAISLYSERERKYLVGVERMLGYPIKKLGHYRSIQFSGRSRREDRAR